MTRKQFIRLSASAGGVGLAYPLLATAWPPTDFAPGPFRRFANSADYLRRKFREDVTDPATGLDRLALEKGAWRIYEELQGKECWCVVKARLFAFLCERMAIDVSPLDRFPAIACWKRWGRPLDPILRKRADEIDRTVCPAATEEVRRAWADGRFAMWHDFDHSAPDWDVIVPLGFGGLSARLDRYRRETPRWRALRITMDAMLSAIDRLAVQGDRTGCAREAAALRRLRRGAPRSAYDVLMFTWLYFFFSEHLDCMQVRSLSQIDALLRPYYEDDIRSGRTTEAEFREDFRCFIWQWGSIDNYWGQPLQLGGSREDGSTVFCRLSRIMLDVLDECALPTPKLQLKVGASTPEWVWDKAVDMARRHRSVVFMGEEGIFRAMKKRGYGDRDARLAAIWGCYEYGPRHSLNTTFGGGGGVNLLKPVEMMLASGIEYPTWESFRSAYLEHVRETLDRCMALSVERESHLEDINPGNVFTTAMEEALANGRDAFANGLPANNGTQVMAAGLGTAVDALLAVRELVYESRTLTLAELAGAMAANWRGHETLRTRMLRSRRKWGNNDAEANALGSAIAQTFGERVNGRSNGRGGRFEASGHAARLFIELGRQTGATPDGRLAGEEISKNLSPTMGVDVEGATALVETLAHLRPEDFPGDFPLDVMLHTSAASGRRGLEAMKSLIRVYHANGGAAIHFNVISVEELKAAQHDPGRYANLQVRVCGWNVRWNDLPPEEQSAYIRRAENMMR